ncbi:hypothetical protein OHPBIL_OHPBIL_07370, partial [Dysosmobacter welbionis]
PRCSGDTPAHGRTPRTADTCCCPGGSAAGCSALPAASFPPAQC